MLIPSDTPGIQLHLRHKRLPGGAPPSAGRSVLLIYGATYPSGSFFDVRLGGFYFMDHLALQGFDAYALDVRGYGGSTRQAEMAALPEDNEPLGCTEVGVRDLGSAVDFLLHRNGLDRINLVAMSWGGSVERQGRAPRAGRASVAEPHVRSDRPRRNPGRLPARAGPRGQGPLGERGARTCADGTDPAGMVRGLGAGLTWLRSRCGSTTPPTMRAVNGPILDIRGYWAADRPLYDPGAITVPVLLVHAEWDVDVPTDLAREYFGPLKGARYRRWIEIGEGTHMVLLEKNRIQAYQAISHFLSEDVPLAGPGGT